MSAQTARATPAMAMASPTSSIGFTHSEDTVGHHCYRSGDKEELDDGPNDGTNGCLPKTRLEDDGVTTAEGVSEVEGNRRSRRRDTAEDGREPREDTERELRTER